MIFIFEIFEKEISVDKYSILLIWDFFVGEIETIICFDMLLVTQQSILARLNCFGIIFEAVIAHGHICVGYVIIVMLLFNVPVVTLYCFLEVILFELLVS